MAHLAEARELCEELLQLVIFSKQFKHINNDNGEFRERGQITHDLDLWKEVIKDFNLKIPLTDDVAEMRRVLDHVLTDKVPELERAIEDSIFATLEVILEVENELRDLVGTWNPDANDRFIIEEERPPVLYH